MFARIIVVLALASFEATSAGRIRKSRNSKPFDGVAFTWAPKKVNLRPVGVILNPGGTVKPIMYKEHMQEWQAQAERRGISMWVSVLGYWGNLALPMRMKQNFANGVTRMEEMGLPKGTDIIFTGHSMGGGASQPQQLELFNEGKIKAIIFQAASISRPFWPPISNEFSFPVPTLTISAELNFGIARITRMAEAMYRQQNMSSTHPIVMIEGMNHMQFATGFEKEDLKPEISWDDAQTQVAKLAVDYIGTQIGVTWFGGLVTREAQKSQSIFAPLIEAFESEGAKGFNRPNQYDVPNNNCPRGVCSEGSPFALQAQRYLLGKDVVSKPDLVVNNTYADLYPFRGGDREGRKPFITDLEDGRTLIQSYVYQPYPGGEEEWTRDVDFPVSAAQVAVKMVSKQYAGSRILGRSMPEDADVCREINARTWKEALGKASPTALARFQRHGQPLVFGPTNYNIAGPLWYLGELIFTDNDANVEVTSNGLFTKPGTSAISGNHYCKLLSPARAMEWIYVDGLQKNLYDIWLP